jgi:hypothetical protein
MRCRQRSTALPAAAAPSWRCAAGDGGLAPLQLGLGKRGLRLRRLAGRIRPVGFLLRFDRRLDIHSSAIAQGLERGFFGGLSDYQ